MKEGLSRDPAPLSDLGALSDIAEDLLESVPAEISARWRQRIKQEKIEDIEPFLRNLLAQRELVKIPRFRSERLRTLDRIPPGLLEKLKSVDEHAVEIDRGHWGRIMRCNTDDIELKNGAPLGTRVLYKILLGPVVGYHNDLESEAGFLAELRTLAETRPEIRVGVPAPYFFISDPRIDIFAMQDISHADSIKNIMDRSIPVPATYPLTLAFDAVRTFVEYMHAEGYYHRDLRAGNIMLNLAATADGPEPLAYIIDTGFAIRTFSEEKAREGMDKTPDDGMINIVQQELIAHLRNRESSV
jgi:serine/threonine protein kinase